MCEISDYIESFVLKEKKIPAFGIEIKRKGESLFSGYYGYSDYEKTKPLRKDDLFFMYSVTKPVTSCAVMRLVEEGKLSLDDRVDKYLPEYANVFVEENGVKRKPSNPITVKHLFTMTAGLTYDMYTDSVNALKERSHNKASTIEVVNAFTKTPLIADPGKRFNYSLCLDVLAAVAEVVTGKNFADYLNEVVFTPLGMKNSYMFFNENLEDKITAQYSCENGELVNIGKNCEFYLTENYVSGGAGLISNPQDYSIFADTIANFGLAKNGYRFLSPQTVKRIFQPEVGVEPDKGGFTFCGGDDYNYGLGVRVRVKQGKYSPIGEFGWDGAAGSFVSMDADSGLSIVISMHIRNWLSFKCIHDDLRELAFKIYSK